MTYFLDKTITLRRTKKKDSNRSVFSATGTGAGYATSWQEPSPNRMQMFEGQLGTLFEAYVDISCPCVNGWQIVKDGLKYDVRDIKVMDFGSMQYKRLTVSRKL